MVGCSFKQEQSETKAKPNKVLQEALKITETAAIHNRSLEETVAIVSLSQRLKDEKSLGFKIISFEAFENGAPGIIRGMWDFFQKNSRKLNENEIKSLVDIVKDKDNIGRSQRMNSYSKYFFQAVSARKNTFENLYYETWESYAKHIKKLNQHSKSEAEIKLLEKVSLKTQAVAYLKYYYGIWEYVSPQENPELANEIKATLLKNLNETYVANLKKNKIDTSWLVGEGSLSEKLFSN